MRVATVIGVLAARRGRDLERAARPPVEIAVLGRLPPGSIAPSCSTTRSGRRPAWLLAHGLAGHRGGRPVHAAPRHGGGRGAPPGVVRIRKPLLNFGSEKSFYCWVATRPWTSTAAPRAGFRTRGRTLPWATGI